MMEHDAPQPVPLDYGTVRGPWPHRFAQAARWSLMPLVVSVPLVCAADLGSLPAIALYLASASAALGFGIAARAVSSADDGEVRRATMPTMLAGCVALALAASIAALLPQTGRARESANRVKCRSNLKQIGLALLLYADDHGGDYPPSLDVLLLHIDITAEVFTCASSSEEKATGATTQQVAQNLVANPAKHCSYVYLPSPSKLGAGPPDRIIAYEPLTNHRDVDHSVSDDGMNVLRENGIAEFLERAAAEHVLAELKAGQNPPRPR